MILNDDEGELAFEIARKAIVAKEGNKRLVRSDIPCPICKTGRLRYAIMQNGHIHAACTTEECVRWSE